MKNTAALSGDLDAWEAEAEQHGSEEIARVLLSFVKGRDV